MDKVNVELTAQEALILFDLLSRWSESDSMTILLQHQAEQRVLWDIHAELESQLVEPILPDYLDRLRKAREMVQDELE